jgi:hypothetical protein
MVPNNQVVPLARRDIVRPMSLRAQVNHRPSDFMLVLVGKVAVVGLAHLAAEREARGLKPLPA